MAIIECPNCGEIFEVQPPNKTHTAASTYQPLPQSFHGKIIRKRFQCKNLYCKKVFELFWYMPLEYFNRI